MRHPAGDVSMLLFIARVHVVITNSALLLITMYWSDSEEDDLIFTTDVVSEKASPELSEREELVSIGISLEDDRIRTIVHKLCLQKPDLLKKLKSQRNRHWNNVRDDTDSLADSVSDKLHKDFGSVYGLAFGKLPMSIDYEKVGPVLFCSVVKPNADPNNFTFAAVQHLKGNRREAEFMYARVSFDEEQSDNRMISIELFRDTLVHLKQFVQKLIFYDIKEQDFLLENMDEEISECNSIGNQLLEKITHTKYNPDHELPDIKSLVTACESKAGRLSHVMSLFGDKNDEDDGGDAKLQRHAVAKAKALFILYDIFRAGVDFEKSFHV